MAAEEKTLNRAALVYPNIEIKDANWLKATLVCFPRVHRIHPRDCVPIDGDGVSAFTTHYDSSGKPLLGSSFIDVMDDKSEDQAPAYEAQTMLRNELEENIKYVKDKFSLRSHGQLPAGKDPYKLQLAKLHGPFYEFLRSNDLVYEENPRDKESYYFPTLCLHPRLGDAIMTVSAISIANRHGFDIVTDSTEYHLAVATLNEQAVVQQLLGRFPDRSKAQSEAEKADEFAQVVISTQFDVSALTPEKIEELHKSADYLAFKDALVPLVSRLPQIDSPSTRKERYEQLARDVIDKWQGTKSLLSLNTAKTLIDASEIKPPEIAWKLLESGTATWICSILGGGILVGVLAFKGYEVYKKYSEIQLSGRYLSQLVDLGAVLAGGPIRAFAGNPEYGMRL